MASARKLADQAVSSTVSGAKVALDVVLYDASGAQITNFGAPTQYTEGDTDTTITGIPALWEDASDTLRAISVSKPLPIQAIYAGTQFYTTHEPAANTQGTITQATAGAGVRNVCTGLTVTFAAGASAPAAVQVAARLRDGSSGAGTILWAVVLSLPATAGASTGVTRSNLWIKGTANTAMTLEFSAAGGANTIQAVALEGTTAA